LQTSRADIMFTTTSSMLPVAAAFAVSAIAALATLFLARSQSAARRHGERIDASNRFPGGRVAVPFTHLGIDVEPPAIPDRQPHAALAQVAHTTKWDDRETLNGPLALAHIDRATAILHEHVRDESSSIAAWLMLLELYRTHGREKPLARLAEEFGERFRATDTQAVESVRRGGADAGLEAFPPVMKLVTMLWGTHECRDLLERLQLDRSKGRRLGLSRAAYIDIAALARVLDTLLAELEADRVEEAKLRAAWASAASAAASSEASSEPGTSRNAAYDTARKRRVA